MDLHVQHPSIPGVLDRLCQELGGRGVREPQLCPSEGSLGLVWQQGRACRGGQVWVSILPCCPVGAPAMAASWRGFPWLAALEPAPALEEGVSQG